MHDRPSYWIASFVLLAAIFAAACNDSSSRRENPLGPGGMNGQGMAGNMGPGMGGPGMGGSGMGMSVSSEFDYLTQMIPHHDEAIYTAGLLERGTDREEMREFARTIIRSQSAEVTQMKAWLAEWYPGRDINVPYMPMMRDLTALRGSALDRAFLEDMIPHHMMAVMMSQQLLNASYARHAEVIPFSRNIRDVQAAEIQMMRQWLMRWF